MGLKSLLMFNPSKSVYLNKKNVIYKLLLSTVSTAEDNN